MSLALGKFNLTLSPNRAWLAFFGLWSMLLTGVVASFIGSPGAIQAIRLKSLLAQKHALVEKLQDSVVKLQDENRLIETSQVAQEREIRRVLGYAGHDELIFDFRQSGTL